jgi:hypothetical protein
MCLLLRHLKKIRKKLFLEDNETAKNCKYCNKQFINGSGDYCSSKCANLDIWGKVMIFEKCACCGRQFTGDSGVYCSYQCEFIASITKKKFYSKKDLRWYLSGKVAGLSYLWD